jgi:RNA-directed DNA polymerase
MLEKAKTVTSDAYTHVEYVRYADDLVILVDRFPRHAWLPEAVNRRLREELGRLRVEVNEEKSRIVDLEQGESFGFLGFDFRRVRSRRGVWRADLKPKLKKRTELLRKLKPIFRSLRSQPPERVVARINPVLRGWVGYFAVGHSSRCFSFVREWVERKMRRHLMRAQKRQGFGWKRWSGRWIHERFGLFDAYRVHGSKPSSTTLPARSAP